MPCPWVYDRILGDYTLDANPAAWPNVRPQLFRYPWIRLYSNHADVRQSNLTKRRILKLEPLRRDEEGGLRHHGRDLRPPEHAGDLHPVEVHERPHEREPVGAPDYLDLRERLQLAQRQLGEFAVRDPQHVVHV